MENTQNASKKKAPAWKSSAAKIYLYERVKSGDIPPDMRPKQVCESFCKDRVEFTNLPWDKNFTGRLCTIREKVAQSNGRAGRDARALAHDRLI